MTKAMDLSAAIASLPPIQMSQLGQTLGDQLAVQTLAAGAPSPMPVFARPTSTTGLASTPPVTLDLSPTAQAVLDGQVSGLQISQLEKAEGIAADPQATGTADSTDPADPFGTGPQIDDGFTNPGGNDDSFLAAALGEPDPSSTPTIAPNPASSDPTPVDEYSASSDPSAQDVVS